MKTIKNNVVMILLIIFPLSVSAQQNFSIGGSGGLLSVDKQSAWNANLFAGYHISETITVGLDLMQSK
ncbi:MAG: hypothetical protein Q4G27_02165 [Flavobacteriaceae bacterium]|nr:hypothetical protein [Flavobacteriaceae bacterium]